MNTKVYLLVILHIPCWPNNYIILYTVKPVMRETNPQDHRKWSYETGGVSSQVQLYRNVGQCYYNSGLLLEVGLSALWALVAGLTVYIYIYSCPYNIVNRTIQITLYFSLTVGIPFISGPGNPVFSASHLCIPRHVISVPLSFPPCHLRCAIFILYPSQECS